jgi:uncharacterized protein (TIGR02757 family)
VPIPDAAGLKLLLERVYADCHRQELIDPDPLLVVRSYAREEDRELVGLFCAVLALGRASAIVGAARRGLAPFGREPAAAIAELGPRKTRERLGLDAYRFFTRGDLSALLSGASSLQVRFGSLDAVFASHAPAKNVPVEGAAVPKGSYSGPAGRLLAGCDAFVALVLDSARSAARSAASEAASSVGAPVSADGGDLARNLLPAPRDGSACKRLMLFLRWMVRRDEVDLGAWRSLSPEELVIPLDTHVHRIALALGLTKRSSPDLTAALETTDALRSFDPLDPVRFDFSLARLGIRSDNSFKDYLNT